MDISTTSKSLVILYYLSSLHLIRATHSLMLRENNIPQKNIRHSRLRPYFLIDNRQLSESVTHSSINLKESKTTKSFAEQIPFVNNQSVNEDASFLYLYEADEISSINDKAQVIDVETRRRVVAPTRSGFRYDGTDLDKSLIEAQHPQSQNKYGKEKIQHSQSQQTGDRERNQHQQQDFKEEQHPPIQLYEKGRIKGQGKDKEIIGEYQPNQQYDIEKDWDYPPNQSFEKEKIRDQGRDKEKIRDRLSNLEYNKDKGWDHSLTQLDKEKIREKTREKPHNQHTNKHVKSHDISSNNTVSYYNSGTIIRNSSFIELHTREDQLEDKGDKALTSINNYKENQFTERKYYHKKGDSIEYSTKKSDITTRSGHIDIVTRFLRIVESQHLLGENCTAGTDLNLGEGVVDRYAQERFRVEADVAVNRANMLTRLWKYSDQGVVMSEYFLHASVFSMVEFDDDIFAAGNCYDQFQYKDYWLFCPYAYRLPEGQILVKDLAVEYKYLSNTSEWFYIARKNAENVIMNFNQFSRGFNTYTWNDSAHTERVPDEILSVTYEDGKWSKPYYDCGGGNIWMLTYTVPFFGYQNNTYFFKGTSGIDIDLRRVDIDQCPLPKDSSQLNIFAASDKCKKRTTDCIPLPGLGFRRGSYKCVCRRGFYFPDTKAEQRYYNGTIIEEEYEKLMLGDESLYGSTGVFECLECAEGCEWCEDNRPCVVSLNWVMRTAILILSCVIISCLPIVILFTWKYQNIKVVRAASPVLLRVIILGALLIYSTNIVMYPRPNIYTCTARVWLREIGFSLTYGALMLKTWRISIIFRVRSAKAVKITDMNLLKRLGVMMAVFCALLIIRTLVAPPHVIVGRTADDLKAYLCKTDWWDHSFTTMEVLFLVWGIRLCIVVRKAPSEFNESKFISMAIYNEFLLSLFLNISMLFLQSPANPDLLYIIFFCHTQLTVTPLLCLIFGSKAYMVFRGTDKSEESSGMMSKTHANKFLNKPRCGNSQYTSTNSSGGGLEYAKISEQDIQEEFRRLYIQLELLKEKNIRFGNKHLVAKILAMQEAASRVNEASVDIHSKFINEKDIHIETKHDIESDIIKVNRTAMLVSENTATSSAFSNVSIPSTANSETQSEWPWKNNSAEINILCTNSACNQEENNKSPIDIDHHIDVVKNHPYLIKSGHAKTHSIVINLDDKKRFTEEVTV